ncbi:DNA gyrase inhibitor YacG [Glaciecola sp.]|jgi:endogenous inhibitor of DNA gyrase (YacG/DUF329 family)|nr:DNA gyrase inhibitor YacG [Glaciecola sp.]MDA7792602.1 DNA gyrase inhibitor YacG [Glaciecola sp.]
MEVACPNCKATVVWSAASEHRPFCSKQCQLIDLGEWADEVKAIPCGANSNAQPSELPDIEDIEALLAQQSDSFFK